MFTMLIKDMNYEQLNLAIAQIYDGKLLPSKEKNGNVEILYGVRQIKFKESNDYLEINKDFNPLIIGKILYIFSMLMFCIR